VEEVSKNWHRRQSNYVLGQFDKDLETNREVSQTVPDQSYTIREILTKFTRGLPLDIKKEGFYENPAEFESENFENAIDITDVEEQANVLSAKIAAAKQSKVKGVVKGAESDATDTTEESKEPDQSETK